MIDALLTAALILDEENTMTSGDKAIYLLTGGYSESKRLGDLEVLADIFSKNKIGFNLLGANFWESETEPDKRAAVPLAKKRNEAALRSLVEQVEGRYYSLPEGCQLLSAFRAKAVAQRPTYTGELKLGDMTVPIRMFLHAKQNPAPPLTKLSAYSQVLQQQDAVEGGGGGGGGGDGGGAAPSRRRGRDDADDGEIEEDDDALPPEVRSSMQVKMERDYVGVIEPDKHYARSDLVRGYRFGRSLVPMTADELGKLKYKAPRTMEVLFFAHRSNLPRHFFMGSPELVVPATTNPAALQFVASLCKALLQQDAEMIKSEPGATLHEPKVALVRLVKQKSGGEPKLGCLLPCLKEGKYYGFYFHRLPFAEDIRKYSFPPLDPAHGCRPAWQASAEQCAAMDDLMDAMDLDRAGPDGTELLMPETTYNPITQHMLDCVRYRASHVPVTVGGVVDPAAVALLPPTPDGRPPMTLEEARRLPPMNPALRSVLEPPKPVWNSPAALAAVERLQNCINLQPVPKKVMKRKWGAAAASAGSGGGGGAAAAALAAGGGIGGIDAASAGAAPGGSLFGGFGMGLGALPDLSSYNRGHDATTKDSAASEGGNKKKAGAGKEKMTWLEVMNAQGVNEVGTVNPVADFRAMCARRDVDKVVDALVQIELVARKLIDESVGGHLYSKAIECFAAMREICIQQSETDHWNGVVAMLRSDFQGRPRHDFWLRMVDAKLTLIHEEESPDSDVSRVQAEEFLKEDQQASQQVSAAAFVDEDEENMFEQMD